VEARAPHAPPPSMTTPIHIRAARPEDELDLIRLAALDSAPAPRGRALVAVVDGAIVAALDLEAGRAIADPFRLTADLVELLRTRARTLGEIGSPARRRWPSLRRQASPIALAR